MHKENKENQNLVSEIESHNPLKKFFILLILGEYSIDKNYELGRITRFYKKNK